ncbi:MAG: metallophosphoesterase [Calothrix sp. C42_A2020_038]|nr:metallophosphoesterase [Calothrix sp. C42_A2020_038]
MKFISEASTSVKIQKMKERVRWRHSSITARKIDQTRMVLDDGKQDNPNFSFMVIGDSGTKPYPGFHPQRKVAEMMLPHREECSFVLHTGDVIYVVGSQEYYPRNFIEPYREFIQGGENYKRIPYNQITFNQTPILPVLGNHDYYDVPFVSRIISGSTKLLRQFFRYKDIEIGWYGSEQGNAFAQAFIDCLGNIDSPQILAEHLDTHYTAKTDTGLCLRYEPGIFTRVPNRYYTFRYGGIDFFALDSDTFTMPSPIPATQEGGEKRRQLSKQRHDIEVEEVKIIEAITKLNAEKSEDAQQLDELNAKLNQIDEIKIDIEKQLASNSRTDLIDWEQLDWFKQRLIESWHSDEVRGRIVYFHHPPYVTEATKWHQAQTLAVRHRLREVFDAVAKTLGAHQERPIVDLILNGHAHCFEYLRTTNTGHADSNINCIISGGSGHRPRPQRQEGNELIEKFITTSGIENRKVADSYMFAGRNGNGEMSHLPYSFVRIDVKAGNPPKFTARPFVAEWYQEKWSNYGLEAFEF